MSASLSPLRAGRRTQRRLQLVLQPGQTVMRGLRVVPPVVGEAGAGVQPRIHGLACKVEVASTCIAQGSPLFRAKRQSQTRYPHLAQPPVAQLLVCQQPAQWDELVAQAGEFAARRLQCHMPQRLQHVLQPEQ